MRRQDKILQPRIDLGITEEHRKVFQNTAYPFTPDISRLCKYNLQLLFVYDEWLSDRHQSFILEDCGARLPNPIGFTSEKFHFLMKSTDQSNVAIPSRDGLRIKGEIFAILPDAFTKLDKLKLNGLRSIRDRVRILYPYRRVAKIKNSSDGYYTDDGHELPEALQGKKFYQGPERIWLLQCWMYMGHPSYWNDMIYQQPFLFDRVPRFTPQKDKTWLSEYYKYQNP